MDYKKKELFYDSDWLEKSENKTYFSIIIIAIVCLLIAAYNKSVMSGVFVIIIAIIFIIISWLLTLN